MALECEFANKKIMKIALWAGTVYEMGQKEWKRNYIIIKYSNAI